MDNLEKKKLVTISKYPFNKDFIFTITIDDLHPESVSDREGLDFGSDTTKPPLRYIEDLIKRIPEIKLTLFAVPNWVDRSDFPSGLFFIFRKLFRWRRSYPEGTFDITKKAFKTWVQELNNFYPRNVSIAMHGYNHHNPDLKYARSQEFLGKDSSQVRHLLRNMSESFSGSGLKYVKGFRPPGWGFDAKNVKLLSDLGIRFLADGHNFSLDSDDGSSFEKTRKGTIYSFVANCFPYQVARAVQIASNSGCIVLHSHMARTEYGLVALNNKWASSVEKLLQELNFQTGKNPWFASLNEICDFIQARDSLQVEELLDCVSITNCSNYDLLGLTVRYKTLNRVIDCIKPGQNLRLDFKEVEQEILATPKVSVVLTVFNGAHQIEGSLKSLLAQDYANFEVIVVNDGSTDNTLSILKKYSDSIVIVNNEKNSGRAFSKNAGLRASTGEITTFCEDDAVYSKEYLKHAVEHFSDSSTLGVIGPHYVFNKNKSVNTRCKDLERRCNFYNYKPFSGWFYKTAELREINGHNEGTELIDDVELPVRLKKKYADKKFVFEPKSIWLHSEPPNFKQYLKRKYKGGIGIGVLHKEGIKPLVLTVTQKFLLATFPVLIGALISTVFYSPTLLFFLIVLAAVGVLLVRIKDIKLRLRISTETTAFVVLSIYVEYIWWFTTFLGILRALISKDPKIFIQRLRKR